MDITWKEAWYTQVHFCFILLLLSFPLFSFGFWLLLCHLCSSVTGTWKDRRGIKTSNFSLVSFVIVMAVRTILVMVAATEWDGEHPLLIPLSPCTYPYRYPFFFMTTTWQHLYLIYLSSWIPSAGLSLSAPCYWRTSLVTSYSILPIIRLSNSSLHSAYLSPTIYPS